MLPGEPKRRGRNFDAVGPGVGHPVKSVKSLEKTMVSCKFSLKPIKVMLKYVKNMKSDHNNTGQCRLMMMMMMMMVMMMMMMILMITHMLHINNMY